MELIYLMIYSSLFSTTFVACFNEKFCNFHILLCHVLVNWSLHRHVLVKSTRWISFSFIFAHFFLIKPNVSQQIFVLFHANQANHLVHPDARNGRFDFAGFHLLYQCQFGLLFHK